MVQNQIKNLPSVSEVLLKSNKYKSINKRYLSYIKKNEYGPASINIENIKIKDSKTEYLKQKNSIIRINQNLIADFNCDKNKKICSILK